jgi:zinc transporter ZupT
VTTAQAVASSGALVIRPAIRLPRWLAPAAAGVFVGAGLFDLLPTAARALGAEAAIWAAAGLLVMVLATRLRSVEHRWLAWAAGIGIAMHSIVEGLAAATGYGAGLAAGLVTSAGLAAHLVPESLALFGLLTASGASLRRAVLGGCLPWALVIIGFATSQHLLTASDDLLWGRSMGFGAGAFVALAGLILFRNSGSLPRRLAFCSLAAVWVASQHLL